MIGRATSYFFLIPHFEFRIKVWPPVTRYQPLFLQLPSTLDAGLSTCFSALSLNVNNQCLPTPQTSDSC
jgi:hypothetical protein